MASTLGQQSGPGLPLALLLILSDLGQLPSFFLFLGLSFPTNDMQRLNSVSSFKVDSENPAFSVNMGWLTGQNLTYRPDSALCPFFHK